jgi:formate dehydrogenase subunit gamma
VLLLSGSVMYLTNLTPLAWRSGATFVHDWFALAVGLLVVGHVAMALRDPHALTGIRTGRVPLRWAVREHAAWAREVSGEAPTSSAP